jgi:hypothetical protein
MAKDNKTQVSDNDPKLVLENGETTNDVVVNDAVAVNGVVKEFIPIAEIENKYLTGPIEKGLLWVRVLLPLAGKFLLPYDPGHEIEIDANQANAIVDAGYGEFIVDESEKI